MSAKDSTLTVLANAKTDLSTKHKGQQDALLTTQAAEASALDAAIAWVQSQVEVTAAPAPVAASPALGAS
jgi:hypothetical protein